jgi:conjugative relaxase-like TrwC/TraI family protein
VTTFVSIRKGHDVRYFTNAGAVGCAGAMAYYTRGGEPPGQWAGKAAARLGLAGQVDPQVLDSLFMQNIAPTGEVLVRRHQGKGDEAAEEAAVRAWRKEHFYASAVEIAEHRAGLRSKAGPKSVPYFDVTVSAVKSVSVLHASLRIDAMQARAAGDTEYADALDRRADEIEQAVLDVARDAVRWLEQFACYTRTGYHSAVTGEWRDGDGLTAALFLHHLSRDGDPQLHVHAAVWNRVQRADGTDDKWRTLHGRALYQQRLGMAPVPDRFLEARLRELGYYMVPRRDGNGCEVGGVSAEVMEQFSSRGVAVSGELARLAAEWERIHGKPPSKRVLWQLHQQAGQNTRRSKGEARRTVNGRVHGTEPSDAERLAEWEAQTTAAEMQGLSEVHVEAERFARERARDRGTTVPEPAPRTAESVHLPPVPWRVLSDADQRRAARVAVAEAQRHHATWSMAQLRYEVHRALGPRVSEADVTEAAELAVSGRAGTPVLQVGAAPDITDVSSLGVRASDGVSVYRAPGEERWCTVEHLDLEAHIVAQARQQVRQLMTEEQARRAVAATDLTAEQQEAVVKMLTARTMTVPLNAAAGSGKSHTMAVFAELWTRFTSARVIGLTTSTNAAEVLANEGLAESYNIAEFLGKVEGSDELRRPVKVNPDDVLVLDEAAQASTVDVGLVQQPARHSGARLHVVGDAEQLGSVEAGGVFSLLDEELDGARLEEVRRFTQPWQAEASQRLRKGEVEALAAYDRRGRVRGADHEKVFDSAAKAWLAEYLRGRDALLLAGSSEEAADLSRRVQAQLAATGRVGPGLLDLADRNMAGLGDLIRARHNDAINAGGRPLKNRDRLLVVSVSEDGQVVARRQIRPGEWTRAFRVPAAYLRDHGELDYAGNVHVSQGRTVTAGHLVVTQTLSRRSFYVGMTRGREENTAWVETGSTAPPGKEPYEQATPESVVKGVMEREAGEESATQQMRAGQEWAGGTGHLLHLWSTAVRDTLYPAIDRQVAGRLAPDQARRYMGEHARQAFHARLREAQLAGHDVAELIDRVTADSLDGARSISSVLHSRLAGLGLDAQHDATWAQRTPDGAPDLARELADGLDSRVRELGVRFADRPEPWLARHLGVLDPAASPAMRAEYERRAGIAASYREAAGITDPGQSIAPDPHEGNPELETARRTTMRALEIRDESEYLRGLSRGELEARVAAGERAMAAVPPDVSAERRAAGQARQDAWAQHADAIAAGRPEEAEGAADLARLMETRERALEPQAAQYEGWSADTAPVRDEAAKARAELARRGYEPDMPPGGDGPGGPETPEPGPEAGPGEAAWWAQFDSTQQAIDALLAREREQADRQRHPARDGEPVPGPDGRDLLTWWREFNAAADRMEAALDAEEAAAKAEGRPWPPPPPPEPTAEEREAAKATAQRYIDELRAEGYLGGPEAAEDPTPVGPVEARSDETAGSVGPAPDPEAGDLDEADEAWRRETTAQAPQPEAPEPVEAQAPDPEPEPAEPGPASEPEPAAAEAAEGDAKDEQAARNEWLDALQARAADAAERAQAERAEKEAGARDYADRQASRAEAGIDPEPDDVGGWQASVPVAEEEMEPG